MSFGIHKPGQGYWVRVMTAVFIGVLGMAGAAWAWGQMQAVDLPDKSWRFAIDGVRGNPASGAGVEMLGYRPEEPQTQIVIGNGIIETYTPSSAGSAGAMIVGGLEFTAEPPAGEKNWSGIFVQSVRSTGTAAGETPALSGEVRTWQAIPVIPVLYVQGAAAGIVILATAIALFIYVGMKRKTVDFLIATDGEMKKVNWSTRKEIIGSTQVVIVATFLIAAILFVIDIGFSSFFEFVGLLQRG